MSTGCVVVICLVRFLSTNPWKILRTQNTMPKLDGIAYGIVMLLLTIGLCGCAIGMLFSIIKLFFIGGRNQQAGKDQIIFIIILVISIAAFPGLVILYAKGLNGAL